MESQLVKSIDNGDESNTKKLHIVMFPWLAFGHIIPFLELSKFIAQKGHKISFISTPRNIDRLPIIPSEFSNSITFVKIPLPKIDGLPKDAEATIDIITSEEMTYLKIAMDGMEKDVTNFLEKNCPDWIIQDFAQYWLAPISAKLGISRIFYSIFNAWFISFHGSFEKMINTNNCTSPPKLEDFLVPPKWIPFETKAAYRLHEAQWMVGSSQKNVSGVSDVYRCGVTIRGSDAIIVRHCHEFEGQWLKLLEDLHHIPVLPTGLMPPLVETLGSEVTVGPSEINELAHGLELSGSPFFWVLRKPSGVENIDPIVLLDGFEERTKGQGIVWKSWAPQMKILSHKSVGGFLTHCGWSSTIEGLMFGHPLIMLPFLVDQGLNARILEDKGVGVEVPRNEENGSYTSNSVANSVKLVMVGNDGKLIREKAKEMRAIFGNKELHDRYIENLIKFLENHRKVKN
ncbi:hypothetical protein MTR67_046646 [Solanum verrucosum]|uniref:Glycosyltransferase n=1 Tax=Solanum verrucosum TaxID=315347 RepID=A0AAF0UYB5_SOLVR|nr:hypothetical protein MTR67_046646 [Solanum verrucosum]